MASHKSAGRVQVVDIRHRPMPPRSNGREQMHHTVNKAWTSAIYPCLLGAKEPPVDAAKHTHSTVNTINVKNKAKWKVWRAKLNHLLGG